MYIYILKNNVKRKKNKLNTSFHYCDATRGRRIFERMTKVSGRNICTGCFLPSFGTKYFKHRLAAFSRARDPPSFGVTCIRAQHRNSDSAIKKRRKEGKTRKTSSNCAARNIVGENRFPDSL